MSWKDPGRQEDGPAGEAAPQVMPRADDEAADGEPAGGMFGRCGLARRIQAVAHGIVGSLPRALRGHAAVPYDAENLSRLTEAMTAWTRGSHLGAEEFAERFFGYAAEELLLEKLHSAALDVVLAISHSELREAADKVAAVMQAIGLDRWPRVLADAQQRARDPATVAAIERLRGPSDVQTAARRRDGRMVASFGTQVADPRGGIAGSDASPAMPRVARAATSRGGRTDAGAIIAPNGTGGRAVQQAALDSGAGRQGGRPMPPAAAIAPGTRRRPDQGATPVETCPVCREDGNQQRLTGSRDCSGFGHPDCLRSSVGPSVVSRT
jgi:hypothetical protein